MAKNSESKQEPTFGERPTVMLTRQEQEIVALAGRSEDNLFPTVDEVRQLYSEQRMPIPPELKKLYPDHCFKWGAVHNIEKNRWRNIPWYVVTRTTHPQWKTNMIGPAGGVIFEGQNVLMYSKRELHDAVQMRNILDIGRKVEARLNGNEEKITDGGGRELGIIERTNQQAGSGAMTTLDDSQPDFGPTDG